jgi:hypothetical protein
VNKLRDKQETANRFLSDDLSTTINLEGIQSEYMSIDVDDWGVQEKDYVLALEFDHVDVYGENNIPLLSQREWGVIPRGYEHPSEAPKLLTFPQYRDNKEFQFSLLDCFPDPTQILVKTSEIKASFDGGRITQTGSTDTAIHTFAVKLCVHGIPLDGEEFQPMEVG